MQGQLEGAHATLVLTDRRLLVCNDREWRPRVVTLRLTGDLSVQGLQDGRSASLLFQSPEMAITVDRIADVALAQDMAGAVRSRTTAPTGNAPPGV